MALREYFLYHRRRLGRLSRVAYRTLHAYVGAALEASDAVPGVIRLAQSFGSLAPWHPHLHVIVTAHSGALAAGWRSRCTTRRCWRSQGDARCGRGSRARAGSKQTRRPRC